MIHDRRPVELPPETLEQLRQTSTASITSELLKLGFRNTFMGGLAPMHPEQRLVGYAFTLRYIPAREDLDMQVDYDNLKNAQRLAVEEVGPNEVLVIDARGEVGVASLGHILATRLLRRGCAGLVTDGALRDSHRIKELGIPTYSRGAHATTASVRHHPVDFGLPIGCGGVMVRPGDIIVGDAEGVVVIPAHVALEVAQKAYERDRLEEFLQQKIDAGASIRGVYPPTPEVVAEYRRQRGK